MSSFGVDERPNLSFRDASLQTPFREISGPTIALLADYYKAAKDEFTKGLDRI